MFAPIKRLIFDIRFRIQEWKIQSKEMDEVDRIEEENCHPMAGLVAFRQMHAQHEERVKQHQIDRTKIH